MSSISERLLSVLGGSYTIERELIGGGMAQVFMGEDHDLGRKVVIKILPPELAASVSAERFRQEILTVTRLQHPVDRKSAIPTPRREPLRTAT